MQIKQRIHETNPTRTNDGRFPSPASPPARAADPEVSLNFFYDNLRPYGSWIDVADYGYVFQPSVAVSNSDWRPYADGYWAYTDVGWTWVSYEDFGWATYHYGRWADLDDYGWIWVPAMNGVQPGSRGAPAAITSVGRLCHLRVRLFIEGRAICSRGGSTLD